MTFLHQKLKEKKANAYFLRCKINLNRLKDKNFIYNYLKIKSIPENYYILINSIENIINEYEKEKRKFDAAFKCNNKIKNLIKESDIESNSKFKLYLLNNLFGLNCFYQIFPLKFTKNINHYQQFPEMKSLINCLIKLREFCISWNDLHYNNIMERKDGTLVISDPGLFKEK